MWGIRGNGEMICAKRGSVIRGMMEMGKQMWGKIQLIWGKIRDVGRNMTNYGENTIKINRVISPHKPVDAGKARNPW